MNNKLLAGAIGLFLATGLYLSATLSRPAQAEPPRPKPTATQSVAQNPDKPDKPDKPGKPVVAWAPAVKPKPLSPTVQTGLDWLVKHQLPNGGWGQGEESQQMGGGANLAEVANVADTCISALALIRAGSTPTSGEHAQSLRKAIGFVCGEVEGSDPDSMQVSKVNGTRVQSKLGPHIDTFLASMLLAEVKGKMGDPAANKQVDVCLAKVLKKIEKNQKEDGTWTREGWAPVLAQGMASKGLNRAAQAGADVDLKTLEKAQTYASTQATAPAGAAGEGSAGVALYSTSSNTGALQDSLNTLEAREDELKDKAKNAPTKKERDEAQGQLKQLDDGRKAQESARATLVSKLDDPGFVAGFGNNGGEEFLSYMNISESLVVKGGEEWQKWDQSMIANLGRVQNKDGSWTGHHCITGRNFCTAAALLVLTADRAPVPITKR
ncbi:MAG: hypothetical protein AMXMBFR33_69980 [Candidatus Xenobia bacterium]